MHYDEEFDFSGLAMVIMVLMLLAMFMSGCTPRTAAHHPNPAACPPHAPWAWVRVADEGYVGAFVDVIAIGTWDEWQDTAAVHGGNNVYPGIRFSIERWNKSLALISHWAGEREVIGVFRDDWRSPCRFITKEDEKTYWFWLITDPSRARTWRKKLEKMRNDLSND